MRDRQREKRAKEKNEVKRRNILELRRRSERKKGERDKEIRKIVYIKPFHNIIDI